MKIPQSKGEPTKARKQNETLNLAVNSYNDIIRYGKDKTIQDNTTVVVERQNSLRQSITPHFRGLSAAFRSSHDLLPHGPSKHTTSTNINKRQSSASMCDLPTTPAKCTTNGPSPFAVSFSPEVDSSSAASDTTTLLSSSVPAVPLSNGVGHRGNVSASSMSALTPVTGSAADGAAAQEQRLEELEEELEDMKTQLRYYKDMVDSMQSSDKHLRRR